MIIIPNYIYQCDNCEFQFERFHSVKEKIKVCPVCDSKDTLNIIIGKPAIHFRGSGFYVNDKDKKS